MGWLVLQIGFTAVSFSGSRSGYCRESEAMIGRLLSAPIDYSLTGTEREHQPSVRSICDRRAVSYSEP